MRHTKPLLMLAVLLVAAALAGCTGGASSDAGSGELVEHDDPVPEGMPVMYEFFTTT